LWLDDLDGAFPDARFVMTHRDPADVMVSVADVYAEVGRMFSDDIDFAAMQRDPIGQVRGLYAWLGEPVTDEFEAGMRGWWEEHAEQRDVNVHPEASEFGLDLEHARTVFAPYTARMREWAAR
jgi:hypothetical protein